MKTVTLKTLTMWRDYLKYRAILHSVEQKKRLERAERQSSLIQQHAEQLAYRETQWMGQESGCPAFLLSGIQQFHGTMDAVLKTQSRVVDNLRLNYEIGRQSVQDAEREGKKLAALIEQQAMSEKTRLRMQEQNTNDDLCARVHQSGAA